MAQSGVRVSTLVAGVAGSALGQAKSIQQVGEALNQLESVVQNQAAASEETASASEELSAHVLMMDEIAGQLDRLVGGAQGMTSRVSGEFSGRNRNLSVC